VVRNPTANQRHFASLRTMDRIPAAITWSDALRRKSKPEYL